MRRFRLWFRGKDGKTHAAVADGQVEFGPGVLAKVKRSLHRRKLPYRVRRVDHPTPGDRIAKTAAKFRHVCESPPYSNDGPWVRKFLAFVGWRRPAPWCAAYFCYVLWLAGYPLPIRSASVAAIEIWARQNGRWVPAGANVYPKPWWGVVYEFTGDDVPDHIGFVRKRIGDRLLTNEGNTSTDDGGSQANGGCVADRNRALRATLHGRAVVKGYVRTW